MQNYTTIVIDKNFLSIIKYFTLIIIKFKVYAATNINK
jgi:hypothetical protein